jgi:hypothetical protein
MWFSLLVVFSALAAPKELPAHRLMVTPGGALSLPEMTIAMVGNTRQSAGLRGNSNSGSGAVIGDITAQAMVSGLGGVIHLGDMVSSSTGSHWRGFAEQLAPILDGTHPPPSALRRYPVLPVVGDRDCAKEPSCESFAKVFPGFGAEIGFGRVATWQHFDLKIGDKDRWRVIVLDSNKKGLGSRWHEQVSWLKTVVGSPGTGILVFLHESPIARGYKGRTDGAQELLDLIASQAPLLSVKGVFSAGPSNNQAFLPEGALGPLYVVAGGGGAPGEDLPRGVAGERDSPRLTVEMEKGLDGLVNSRLKDANEALVEASHEALGTGSFKTYPRVIDASTFPMFGWWRMKLSPGSISLGWRAQLGDGTFTNVAGFQWSQAAGWKAQ